MKWVWVLERSTTNVDGLAVAPLISRLGIFRTYEKAHERLEEWTSGCLPKAHEKLIMQFRIVQEPLGD